MQKLKQTLLWYANQHLPSLPGIYEWPLKQESVPAYMEFSFAGSNYDKTRALRRSIAREWTSSPQRRHELADYAVRIWGGVKTNAPTTINRYVELISNGQLPPCHKGIASWSKVAAFSDPDKYAIFDCRVSFALNSIQALYGDGSGVWFPKLPGRNSLLNAKWPSLASHATQRNWQRIERTIVYSAYLESLSHVAQECGIGIENVEMLLFAKAENLAEEI